jgi:transposase
LAEIKVPMECTPSKQAFIRFQAIYYLYQGQRWEFVAQLGMVSSWQLLRWVHAFNARGIDGLVPKARPGRARKLSREVFVEKVLPVVREPAKVQETHWTGVKLHGWLKSQLQIELGSSTLLRYLHEHDFRTQGAATLARRPRSSAGREVCG